MKVNEIFYSLQGEGVFTGTAAIFVRLAGCNLHCDFCDTKHEDYTIFTEEEIVKAISDYPAKHVVITGGEPTLQLTHSLVDRLHEVGKFVQIETNGSIALDTDLEWSIDWITCSPKTIPVKIQRMKSKSFIRDKIWNRMKKSPQLMSVFVACNLVMSMMR